MSDFNPSVDIKTTRLHLREVEERDIAALQAYGRDPEFKRYEDAADLDETSFNRIMQGILGEKWQRPRYSYYASITPLKDARLTLGSIYVAIRHEEHRQGEIGYVLGREHWGHGYATESAQAMLGFGFTTLRLHRIYAECNSENVASQRVLERIGMHREGHLRQTQYFSGRWWDTLIYGILRHEWQASQP